METQLNYHIIIGATEAERMYARVLLQKGYRTSLSPRNEALLLSGSGMSKTPE